MLSEKSIIADPDPGSGIRCFYDPWIRDGKNQDPGSGMTFPDFISESLGNKFWVKKALII
jgi:hypothetical protein